MECLKKGYVASGAELVDDEQGCEVLAMVRVSGQGSRLPIRYSPAFGTHDREMRIIYVREGRPSRVSIEELRFPRFIAGLLYSNGRKFMSMAQQKLLYEMEA